MKNINKIYFYYTFNRPNIIILGISMIVICIMFNLYDFDVSLFDYMADMNYYHMDYIAEELGVMIPLSLVVIMLITSIDFVSNNKKFDILFISKLDSKDILKIKLKVYFTLSFIYISLLYLIMIIIGIFRFSGFRFSLGMLKLYFSLLLQSFEAIIIIFIITRLTKNGYSSIIVLLLYFISLLISEYSEIISNIVFINVDALYNGTKIGLFPAFAIDFVYALILTKLLCKKEFK